MNVQEVGAGGSSSTEDHVIITVDTHVTAVDTHVDMVGAYVTTVGTHVNTVDTHDMAPTHINIVDTHVDTLEAHVDLPSLPPEEENDPGGTDIPYKPEESVVVVRLVDSYSRLPQHNYPNNISDQSISPGYDDLVTINIDNTQAGSLTSKYLGNFQGDIGCTPTSDSLCVNISTPSSTPLISQHISSSPTTCDIIANDLQNLTAYSVENDGILTCDESQGFVRDMSINVSESPAVISRLPAETYSASSGKKIHVRKSGCVMVKVKDPNTVQSVPAGTILITREMDDGKSCKYAKFRIMESQKEVESPSPPYDIPVHTNNKNSEDPHNIQVAAAAKKDLDNVFLESHNSDILIKRHIGDLATDGEDFITIDGKKLDRMSISGSTKRTTGEGMDQYLTKLSESRHSCCLCTSVINSGEKLTLVPCNSALPLSSLDLLSLLKCLGVCPPFATDQPQASFSLCQQCYTLVLDGDAVYKRVLGLTAQMKQQWLDGRKDVLELSDTQRDNKKLKTKRNLSRTLQRLRKHRTARKLKPIFPNPEVLGDPRAASVREFEGTPARIKEEVSNKMLICGFCGMDLYGDDDFRLHSAAVHRIKPMWQQWANQQPVLKTRLAKEIQRSNTGSRGDRKTNLRKCTACGKEYPVREEFVEHLRLYHNMTIDEEFLAYVAEESSVRGWSSSSQLTSHVGLVAVKSEAMWEEVEASAHNCEEDSVDVVSPQHQAPESTIKGEKKNEATELCMSPLPAPDECQNFTEPVMPENRGSVPQSTPSPEKGQGGQWRCRLCSHIFSSQGEHDQHKLSRHPESVRVKRCKILMENKKNALLSKLTNSLPKVVKANVTCKICGKIFDDQEAQNKHLYSCHGNSVVVLEGDGSGGVKHHRVNILSVDGLDAEEGEEEEPVKSQWLEVHKGSNVRRNFVCGSCEELFTSRPMLLRHKRLIHGEAAGVVGGVVMVECELCGRRLHSISSLRLHLSKIHHRSYKTPLRHRCKLCIFQCRTRTQLERHMQEKHGANVLPPVRCADCGKTYSAKYIEKHIANIHENLKKYSCNFCSMKYNLEASLKSHIFYEHANNKWRCEICQLEFDRYHQLRQHRIYVHSTKLFPCRECERSFKRKGDLTEHIKRRHRARIPSKCIHCPKVYSDRKKLRTHLMTKHGVPWEDTLAKTFARHQRESNCLRKRLRYARPTQGAAEDEAKTVEPGNQPEVDGEGQELRRVEETDEASITTYEATLDGQHEYNVVQVTEGSEHLSEDVANFSYIILEES